MLPRSNICCEYCIYSTTTLYYSRQQQAVLAFYIQYTVQQYSIYRVLYCLYILYCTQYTGGYYTVFIWGTAVYSILCSYYTVLCCCITVRTVCTLCCCTQQQQTGGILYSIQHSSSEYRVYTVVHSTVQYTTEHTTTFSIAAPIPYFKIQYRSLSNGIHFTECTGVYSVRGDTTARSAWRRRSFNNC